MNKSEIIEKVNYDKSGHGSIGQTLTDARHIDKTITYSNVKDWFDENIENKRQLKGQNSFIANHAYQEFEIDMMFFSDLLQEVYY